jgi:intein-encoded DNA endonuclease-like protein
MGEGDGAGEDKTVAVPIKFYRGVKAIAKILEMHPETVGKLIREGKIPARRDKTGRWVLTSLNYYQAHQE